MAEPPPTKPDRRRYTFLELAEGVDTALLERVMRSGTTPDFGELLGWEFDGANTAAITKPLRIRKFCKGIYEGPPRARSAPEPYLQGYNIPVAQNALTEPHLYRPSSENPKRFGFYRVHAVVPGSLDAQYPQALLLDYGLGGNGLRPERFLRDYLIQVYPDDPELLVGKAYLAVGTRRVPVSFFVLRRSRRHSFRG